MFQPSGLKALRGLSATQREQDPKELVSDINNVIEDLKKWKEEQRIKVKWEMNENQKQQSIFKSGYEDDNEEDIFDQVAQKSDELNKKLISIRNAYRRELLHIPSYMSSQMKTNEINNQLAISIAKLEGLQTIDYSKINIESDDCQLMNKLNEWTNTINEIDQFMDNEVSNQIDLEQLKKYNEEWNKEQEKQVKFNDDIKNQFQEMDKEFDEIDDLLNQCGIK